METIYPVVVITIIGFNSSLCLCRLYDLLEKEMLELLYVHILSTPDQYCWIFCNTRGHREVDVCAFELHPPGLYAEIPKCVVQNQS